MNSHTLSILSGFEGAPEAEESLGLLMLPEFGHSVSYLVFVFLLNPKFHELGLGIEAGDLLNNRNLFSFNLVVQGSLTPGLYNITHHIPLGDIFVETLCKSTFLGNGSPLGHDLEETGCLNVFLGSIFFQFFGESSSPNFEIFEVGELFQLVSFFLVYFATDSIGFEGT